PFMAPPLVYNPTYNSWVSYTDGDYSVAHQNPYDMSNFSAILNQTIARTETVEPIMKTLYFTNREFIAGYTGFLQDGLFREYPGASNGNLTQLMAWDTRDDDWWWGVGYQTQRQTLYTSVYFDPWVKKTMITIVRSVHNIETGDY